MERRNFIRGAALGCAGLTVPASFWQTIFAYADSQQELFNIPRPLDTKINIKPLFGVRIPAELHEGPCRPDNPSLWDKEEEKENAQLEFQSWKKTLYETLGKNVMIQEPVYVEYAGNHIIDTATWSTITKDDASTDLYVLSHYRIPGLGAHTDKAIALVGNACATLDVNATLRSRGETVYGAIDYHHLSQIIDALKVKKALSQTKMLAVSDGKWDYEFNAVRSNIDTNILKDKFGVDSHYITIDEMMDEFRLVEKDKDYLDLADKITYELLQHAEKSSMPAENIKPSILYYLTAKKMMQKYGCNGFTATCQEFCVSLNPMQHRVTPCITHTLLKDEGYISVCEADTNAFFSMGLQMYTANKTPYMGNTLIYKLKENQLQMIHDVPGRKMHGYDQPDLPYSIESFTERNWGATMRYEFSRDAGKEVTFCRTTPAGDKVLAVKGVIQGGAGVEGWGCRLKAYIEVSDAMHYFNSAQQTGHHFSLVYGDYTDQLQMLAKILNMEIEVLA